VLFTSGVGGHAKASSSSHANILANRHQIGAVVDFNPTDTVFNALPVVPLLRLTAGC